MSLLIMPPIFILSLLFTLLEHPLALGLTLLTQTVLISLNLGLATYSFWFSYILFLIFLGGMLVLFIYVASLASNEMFKFSLVFFFTSFFLLMFFSLLLFFSDNIFFSFLNLISSSIETKIFSTFIISWIYSTSLMKVTSFVIFYLLFTLIVVVKITNMFKGPLRVSN
uniref:NADH-ubiquinone oxidoreductase chain 6 n=1 Tax=Scyra compressipes TaxID=1235674 RepID=A0A891SFY1_9EUCA|nr:NADH dehydrogenase subunit 6 [Scyra compressipes]QRM82008.1 NADH dehydrogenase subunit 6 [Scyra compressipes]